MKNQALQSLKQQGVVLFVALIALVVMSLAAVALIRSVDTNTIIAGNMALKHSALVSSDRGVETALDWLAGENLIDLKRLEQDNVASGYYSTFIINGSPDLDDRDVLKAEDTWASAAKAKGVGIVGGTEVSSGNEIKFIIQRMCRVSGMAANANCLQGAPKADKGSLRVGPDCCPPEPLPEPIYRITTRVAGAKNTFSYAQTFVY
ncbi:pilus assembly PilX N-terminal domain-containing protein [Methylotenera sp.]|uniref:pilus assembly PilX family protein n=1 Tax=Methylotenera sp. TaxID=2051956 RepID=UPI00273379A8|nr:pilus assembly PilX N-terminal domain-containing protein [Methylotenera sp.]MDP3777861.1 pilus assembly PilX N-terminal domain-containing protein [Methylotenera sp.]